MQLAGGERRVRCGLMGFRSQGRLVAGGGRERDAVGGGAARAVRINGFRSHGRLVAGGGA